MAGYDPKRTVVIGQTRREIRTLWKSMRYMAQGRIVRFADRNGGARAPSILELMRLVGVATSFIYGFL
jgi:hypothetical protein